MSLAEKPINLLFVGAGASFGARAEHENTHPPLGIDLLDFLKNSITQVLDAKWKNSHFLRSHALFETVLTTIRKSKSNDFEKFISTLDTNERSEVNLVLCIFFSTQPTPFNFGFNTGADQYDSLITRGEFTHFISLNYDLLLEDAINRKFGRPYFYGPKGQTQGLPILKPHGSINYFGSSNHPINFGELPEIEDSYIPTSLHINPKTQEVVVEHGNTIAHFPISSPQICTSSFLGTPIIANYRHGKDTNINEKLLREIRTESIDVAREANSATIIGVKPSNIDDDETVWSIFTELNCETVYVSPSSEDCDRAKSLLKRPQIVKLTFEEFLKRNS